MADIRDIRKHTEAVDAINAILNNRGIAEVKFEERDDEPTVVEIRRTLKTAKRRKKE